MKKLVVALTVTCLLFSGVLGNASEAKAATSGKLYAGTDATVENLKDSGMQFGKGGSAEDDGIGVIGLQPAADDTGAYLTGTITFTVDVDTAGEYKVGVVHAAKGADGVARKADIMVNGGERTALAIVSADSWDIYNTAVVRVNLVAGTNTITIVSPADFDSSTVKCPNIDYITYSLVAASTPDVLPQTGTTPAALYFLCGAMLVLAGVIVSRKSQAQN